MNTITKDAIISLLLACFPYKKREDFHIKKGICTNWIYVKIDDTYYGPNELYDKTGLDLRGLELYDGVDKADNLRRWKNLTFKI